MSPPAAPGSPAPDPGRYVSIAPRSIPVVAVYLILAAALFYYRDSISTPWAFAFLSAVLLVYLVRYVSTYYVLDSDELKARRLFGSRRIRFEDIRAIQLANLRDLGPVGLVGTWGWRGRVWSPIIGSFDTVHTVSPGLLITAGKAPIFISPRDPVAFGRELSRRARSWGVDLASDPGALSQGAPVGPG
jgi:Bacterial PH domain